MEHQTMYTMFWCESKTTVFFSGTVSNKGVSYLKSLISEIHMGNIKETQFLHVGIIVWPLE